MYLLLVLIDAAFQVPAVFDQYLIHFRPSYACLNTANGGCVPEMSRALLNIHIASGDSISLSTLLYMNWVCAPGTSRTFSNVQLFSGSLISIQVNIQIVSCHFVPTSIRGILDRSCAYFGPCPACNLFDTKKLFQFGQPSSLSSFDMPPRKGKESQCVLCLCASSSPHSFTTQSPAGSLC